MAWQEFEILKKIHPKADVYFIRIAMLFGIVMLAQILTQLMAAIQLLK